LVVGLVLGNAVAGDQLLIQMAELVISPAEWDLREPESNLLLGGLDTVGAVADVLVQSAYAYVRARSM
jgi:hypothetical protein